MCNDEPGGVVNGWTCDGKGKLTRAGSIPDGMMLVSKAWQPIMDEVERRAEKMDGNTDDFTVTIRAEDYRDILM
jgi:hypothetical protein